MSIKTAYKQTVTLQRKLSKNRAYLDYYLIEMSQRCYSQYSLLVRSLKTRNTVTLNFLYNKDLLIQQWGLPK